MWWEHTSRQLSSDSDDGSDEPKRLRLRMGIMMLMKAVMNILWPNYSDPDDLEYGL